jgi:hypothetical protein
MDKKEIDELTRQADRQLAVDRARDATLRASSRGRVSGERVVERMVARDNEEPDPGPIEGASGS